MNRPTLNPDEKRVFDVIADVPDEWSTKPRCAEKAGANAAIGTIWHRLGWSLLGLDENDKRASEG